MGPTCSSGVGVGGFVSQPQLVTNGTKLLGRRAVMCSTQDGSMWETVDGQWCKDELHYQFTVEHLRKPGRYTTSHRACFIFDKDILIDEECCGKITSIESTSKDERSLQTSANAGADLKVDIAHLSVGGEITAQLRRAVSDGSGEGSFSLVLPCISLEAKEHTLRTAGGGHQPSTCITAVVLGARINFKAQASGRRSMQQGGSISAGFAAPSGAGPHPGTVTANACIGGSRDSGPTESTFKLESFGGPLLEKQGGTMGEVDDYIHKVWLPRCFKTPSSWKTLFVKVCTPEQCAQCAMEGLPTRAMEGLPTQREKDAAEFAKARPIFCRPLMFTFNCEMGMLPFLNREVLDALTDMQLSVVTGKLYQRGTSQRKVLQNLKFSLASHIFLTSEYNNGRDKIVRNLSCIQQSPLFLKGWISDGEARRAINECSARFSEIVDIVNGLLPPEARIDVPAEPTAVSGAFETAVGHQDAVREPWSASLGGRTDRGCDRLFEEEEEKEEEEEEQEEEEEEQQQQEEDEEEEEAQDPDRGCDGADDGDLEELFECVVPSGDGDAEVGLPPGVVGVGSLRREDFRIEIFHNFPWPHVPVTMYSGDLQGDVRSRRYKLFPENVAFGTPVLLMIRVIDVSVEDLNYLGIVRWKCDEARIEDEEWVALPSFHRGGWICAWVDCSCSFMVLLFEERPYISTVSLGRLYLKEIYHRVALTALGARGG